MYTTFFTEIKPHRFNKTIISCNFKLPEYFYVARVYDLIDLLSFSLIIYIRLRHF